MDVNIVLSDQEKAKIEAFVADKECFEAVRKVLLFGIYNNGVLKLGEEHDPTVNFALTQVFKALNQGLPINNEELGQNLRAQAAGIKLVAVAFGQLESIQEVRGESVDAENSPNKAE